MAEDKLAVPQSAALARPSFLGQNDTRGTESITKDDLQMPRLALAQKGSPQIEETDPKFIEGLKVGHLFNSLTGKSFGTGPLRFTVLRTDRPRWIEFNPIELGGGIKDPNVQAGDPRTLFGPGGEAPIATKFYDFIIALLPLDANNPMETVISLSLKSSGLPVAKKLNSLMKWRNAPTFAGAYELSTAMDEAKGHKFAIYTVQNHPTQPWVSEDEFKVLELMYNALKDKEINIDREAGAADTDGTDFPYGANAASASDGGM